jgi:hypothetical protein
VEAADDELLLARVGVDVAHREHAAFAGLELLGVHRHLLALEFQAPVGDRAQARRNAQAGDQRVERQRDRGRVRRGDLQLPAVEGAGLADLECHLAFGHQGAHGGDRGLVGLEAVTAVHQRDLLGDGCERQGRFQRDVVAAIHHHRLPRKALQRFGVIEKRSAFELRDAIERDALGHEGTNAGCDEHRLREERLAGRRRQQQALVGLALQRGNLLTEVKPRPERRHLLQQRLRQRAPAGHGRARNVVDGLVAVQRHALAARGGQCIDDVAGDFKQAQLEGLEQPDGAGTDDQRVGFDGRGGLVQRTSSPTLSVLSFHSSASGSAGLRLVMLFQPSARASSALILMKAIWLAGRSSSA